MTQASDKELYDVSFNAYAGTFLELPHESPDGRKHDHPCMSSQQDVAEASKSNHLTTNSRLDEKPYNFSSNVIKIDIEEYPSHYDIYADLPGANSTQIKVQMMLDCNIEISGFLGVHGLLQEGGYDNHDAAHSGAHGRYSDVEVAVAAESERPSVDVSDANIEGLEQADRLSMTDPLGSTIVVSGGSDEVPQLTNATKHPSANPASQQLGVDGGPCRRTHHADNAFASANEAAMSQRVPEKDYSSHHKKDEHLCDNKHDEKKQEAIGSGNMRNIVSERHTGNFRRLILLDHAINKHTIVAKFHAGLLHVRAQKDL